MRTAREHEEFAHQLIPVAAFLLSAVSLYAVGIFGVSSPDATRSLPFPTITTTKLLGNVLATEDTIVPTYAVLDSVGASDEFGVAEFFSTDGTEEKQVEVSIDFTADSSAAGRRSVYLYEGSCGDLGMPVRQLNDIVDGKSFSVIPASLTQLREGSYAITVWRSLSNPQMVACGNIEL
ncbi:hypothetical protein D6779_12020 [Candidatus Parcubacteria bacterium]|nr:MAG: hypothetical protein D6779_12020 [Candidatus Parcubacteria bacterium]